MPAPVGAPCVRRRAEGLREANRTPATQPNPAGCGHKRRCDAAGEQENPPGTREKAGGGGAGQPRPERSDTSRQRRLALGPAQADALQQACAAYRDPQRRMVACALLRHENLYDPVLPLSPAAVPCSSPDCRCKMSYRQLTNGLGLGSPSAVRCLALHRRSSLCNM